MTGEVCGKCRQHHPKCRGHNRRGGPCGCRPSKGQKVCRLHGGESPQAQAAARRAEVERKAVEVLKRRWIDAGEVSIDDPLGELARVAGEAVAFKDYLRDEVSKLDGVLAYWTEETFETEEEIRTKASEELRAVVTAYERSLDRCAKILASIVKLDLAGRMLAVREEQATMIVGAVRYGLGQVDMPAELRRGAQEAIADALAGLSRPAELTA